MSAAEEKPKKASLEALVGDAETFAGKLASAQGEHERVLGDFDQVLARIDTSLRRGRIPVAEQAEAERLAAQLRRLEARVLLRLDGLSRDWKQHR